MKKTQGRTIISAIRRRPMTYLEMVQISGSLSPQKRVMESLGWGEVLVKGSRSVGGRHLVTWRVVAG